MASNLPSENIFDEICQQIIDTFRELIKQLTDRRVQLLGEVRRRKSEFEERLNSQRESLKQLETVRIQIEQISLSQTQSSNVLQSSLAPIQKQISDLKNELVPTPNLKFECSQMSSQFRKLGAVIVNNKKSLEIDYSKKVKATHVLSEIGNDYDRFEFLKKIHIDGTNLYVINNSRVRIFEMSNLSLKCKNINLQNCCRQPHAIATNKDHCYITGTCVSYGTAGSCFICKLDKCNFQITRVENKIPFGNNITWKDLLGLAILEDEIFVSCLNSRIIHVYDLDLHYRRNFELLNIPGCVRIKENRLYVLDGRNSLHYFDLDGQLIGDSHEFFKPIIQESPKLISKHSVDSFCFDPSGNAVLVSNGRIIVVTSNGEEIYSIGKGSQCSEDISGCNSVAVFQDKLIVSCPGLGYVKIF